VAYQDQNRRTINKDWNDAFQKKNILMDRHHCRMHHLRKRNKTMEESRDLVIDQNTTADSSFGNKSWKHHFHFPLDVGKRTAANEFYNRSRI
jgi:hypothetical protein